MTRYQLAKVVDWAGTLDTRKRMQKVIYLLQIAGCPLEIEYTLHFYGPYSQEVARLTDELVRAQVLVERAESNLVGQQFSYQLTDEARHHFAEFELTPRGKAAANVLTPFEPLARQLFQVDLKDLEYASTVVFFRTQGYDWPMAIAKMCDFKRLTRGHQVVEQAEATARQVVA